MNGENLWCVPVPQGIGSCAAWQVTVGALLTVPGNGKEYSAVATVFAGALQVLVSQLCQEVTNGGKLIILRSTIFWLNILMVTNW